VSWVDNLLVIFKVSRIPGFLEPFLFTFLYAADSTKEQYSEEAN